MRDFAKWMLLPFAVALGVAVAYRMSAEAMAVVVGVIFGVLTSVVMSGVMLVALRFNQQRMDGEQTRRGPMPAYPPVVIVQPGGMPMEQTQRAGWENWLPASLPQREFTIMGDESEQRMMDQPWQR